MGSTVHPCVRPRLPPPLSRFAILLAVVLAVAPAASPGMRAAAATDDTFRRTLVAAADGNWADVRALATRLEPELAAYFYWRELFESEREFPFATIAAFLERHPGWPEEARLRRLAERRVRDDTPAERVVEHFTRFPPLTAEGRFALARALLALGHKEKADAEFARAFPELPLDRDRLQLVRSLFGHRIDAELLWRRVDRLLRQGRITEARRLLPRLDDGHRRLAIARIALRTTAPGVDRAIRAVPPSLRGDPGLAYERLAWRLRKGRHGSAREILLHPPSRLQEPGRWWRLREAEIRRELERGRPRLAWQLARSHGQRDGLAFAEAEWLAGWLALRFADRPEEALERFVRLYEGVGTPVSLARAAYWAGRAAERLGREEDARRWYRRAARHPTAYYGQLAADRLGVPLEFGTGRRRLDGTSGAPSHPTAAYDPDDERLAVARALCRLPRDEHAEDFFLAVADEVDADAAMRLLAAVRRCGRAYLYVVVAKRLAFRGVADRLQTFPLLDPAYLGDGAGTVAPALLAALARQESHFAHDARSRAGARGMTQILPGTARAIAERLGVPFSLQRLGEDPYYQMALARAHLERLIETYDGCLELVVAAYNAGSGRVRRWIRRFGDPRRMTADERIDWVERLPFAETRNYVQRVLEGRRVYERLLEDVEDGLPLLTTGGRAIPYPAPVPRPGGSAT